MCLNEKRKLRDGEPCEHSGCLSHISHPCEGCGRIGGRYMTWLDEIEKSIREFDTQHGDIYELKHIKRMARVIRELVAHILWLEVAMLNRPDAEYIPKRHNLSDDTKELL
jgi:hypothetical protein